MVEAKIENNDVKCWLCGRSIPPAYVSQASGNGRPKCKYCYPEK